MRYSVLRVAYSGAFKASILFGFGAAVLLSACAAPSPAPSASPAPTLSHTPTASHTPIPLPSASHTPTPSPSPTHTPTLTPTPSPTPPSLNPLTGLPVPDPAVLERRPLAIKVAHFPRGVRVHQSGLSLADHVWEHYAEGGVTRFTAVFLGQGAERVGNVRSARLIDTYLGQAYQALLVASGSSQGTLDRLARAGLWERLISEATGFFGCPLLCREGDPAETTDKLFTSTAALWELAEQLELNGPQELAGLTFAAEPPAGAQSQPAETVHIDFQRDNTVVEWRYDGGLGVYLRWIDTASLPALEQHLDSLNGRALSAANVVVLFVPHQTSNIREDENGRYFSYDILLTGTGPARLFRDERMMEAAWTREGDGLPRLLDPDGRPLPLKPGNTWFEVLSSDSPESYASGIYSARFKAPNPFPATATATAPVP